MPDPKATPNAPRPEEAGSETAAAQPIAETPESVSYLGVRLEKAQKTDSGFVPRRETYSHYINDRWALEFQRKIATSFLPGDPILIEGGTSIGKTTTVRKMAAELGWEVHYVNLNGATDVEDLMGRYIPNPHRRNPEDPEYIFADGKVTSGLRQEEGRTKVIILDEFNAAAPNIVIRLHEVIDALEKNAEVILAEDASEAVRVSKERTKIIALTNPPGKEFLGREPLDPAQLRRWVYQKEVTELPKETFDYATKALFGLAAETETVDTTGYMASRADRLTDEQLREVPGMKEILALYIEFHAAAKKLVKQRTLAADQPQPFTFDDREEPRRVSEFVRRFYNGDITETFQAALRYYYQNKLEQKADRDTLEELLGSVIYVPPVNSHHRGPERTKPEQATQAESRLKSQVEQEIADLLARPEIPESVKNALRNAESKLSPPMAEAATIFGSDFFGPDEIRAAFKFTERDNPPNELLNPPAIPFSKEELAKAKELGQMLVLRVPMTMREIQGQLVGKVNDGKNLLYSADADGKLKEDAWYKNEKFYTEQRMAARWVLVSKDVVPETTSKNYLEQTDALVEYVKNQVFKDKPLPAAYQTAIEEFTKIRVEIAGLIGSNWQKAAEKLEGLQITQLTRQTPAEALYDLTVHFQDTGTRLLPNRYTWTSRRGSDGRLVHVGGFGTGGVYVLSLRPVDRGDRLGVVFSRSL